VKTNKLNYGYLYEYDESGNQISTGNIDSEGEVSEYYVRTFNENGVAITENVVDLEGQSKLRIKYEYRPQADSTWTEQLTYYNDVLKEIRFREKVIIDNLINNE